MNQPQTVSVILSTYNSPRYLAMALQALQHQGDDGYEVVVADDGSAEATREVIAAEQAKARCKIVHAWHEDCGFRAAAARNNAVRLAAGDYLVFLDGDCLARPDFIAAHRRFAEPGYLVRGSRIMLREDFTRRVFAGQAIPASYWAWIRLRLARQVKRIGSLFPLPFTEYRNGGEWRGIKTCNLGMWRKDFEAVNGFDERYVGWGHEDADLAVRLLRHGVRRKEGRASIPVIHLWHEESPRDQLSVNEQRLQGVLATDTVYAEPGLH